MSKKKSKKSKPLPSSAFRTHNPGKGYSEEGYILATVNSFIEKNGVPTMDFQWEKIANLFNDDSYCSHFCRSKGIKFNQIVNLRTAKSLKEKYQRMIKALRNKPPTGSVASKDEEVALNYDEQFKSNQYHVSSNPPIFKSSSEPSLLSDTSLSKYASDPSLLSSDDEDERSNHADGARKDEDEEDSLFSSTKKRFTKKARIGDHWAILGKFLDGKNEQAKRITKKEDFSDEMKALEEFHQKGIFTQEEYVSKGKELYKKFFSEKKA
jgi:hypothetical protein